MEQAVEVKEDWEVHMDKLHKDSKGFITIAQKNEGRFRQYHYKKDDAVIEIKKLLGEDNVYISQNTFYRTYRRYEYLKELNNIYIDLDFKKKSIYKNLKHFQVLKLLQMDYFNISIPEPSLIINSGNGFHLIWNIEPVPVNSSKVVALWYAETRYIHNQLKDFGSDPQCIDVCRLLRQVRTMNTSSYTLVRIEDVNNYRYTMEEIQEGYLPELKPKKVKAKGRPKKIVSLYTEYSLYFARTKDLIRLCELRNWEMTGHREFILFLYRYWTCHFTSDTGQALEYTLEINSTFTMPLIEKTVKTATRSAERVFESNDREYKYKNSTIIEMLDITPEEQAHMRTIIGTRVKYDRKNEKRNKARRNEEGLTLREQKKKENIKTVSQLLARGLGIREISRQLEINISTVSKIKNNKY